MQALPAPNLTRCPGRTGHCGAVLLAEPDGGVSCLSGHAWWPYGFQPFARDAEQERRLKLTEAQTGRRRRERGAVEDE